MIQRHTKYLDKIELQAKLAIETLHAKNVVVITKWKVAERVAAWLLKNDHAHVYAADRRGRSYVFGLTEKLYPPEQPKPPKPQLTVYELYSPAVEEFLERGYYVLSTEYSALDFLTVAHYECERLHLRPERIRYEMQEKNTVFYLVD